MEKLRHVEIGEAELDLKWENNKKGMFEESTKLENLSILRRVVIHEGDRIDVLLQRCPNLQQLDIIFSGDEDSAEICLKFESLTQLQMLRLSLLMSTRIDSVIPFIAGLPNLEYLQLSMTVQCQRQFRQSEEWCLGDITFHKLKFLKLVFLDISRWNASDESFPLLETLVISWCDNLEEIPLSFADIPTLKQIKLIWCDNKSLEASAVRIKEEVKDIEGCDVLTSLSNVGGEIQGKRESSMCLLAVTIGNCRQMGCCSHAHTQVATQHMHPLL